MSMKDEMIHDENINNAISTLIKTVIDDYRQYRRKRLDAGDNDGLEEGLANKRDQYRIHIYETIISLPMGPKMPEEFANSLSARLWPALQSLSHDLKKYELSNDELKAFAAGITAAVTTGIEDTRVLIERERNHAYDEQFPSYIDTE